MARREAANLLDLLKIREGRHEKIDAINGNLGSALGFKHTDGRRTDHPAILVFVPKKIHEAQLAEDQIVPKELGIPDGEDVLYCKTDVVRGGKAEYLKEPPPPDKANREIVERLRGGGVGSPAECRSVVTTTPAGRTSVRSAASRSTRRIEPAFSPTSTCRGR